MPVVMIDLQSLPGPAADGAETALEGDQGVNLGRREPVNGSARRRATVRGAQHALAGPRDAHRPHHV